MNFESISTMVSVICMKGKSHELQYAEFQGDIVIETYLKTIEMLVVNVLGMTVSNPFIT